MPPRANTSARSSAASASPRACSGGMYAGVPSTRPAAVRPSRPAGQSSAAPAGAGASAAGADSTFASPQSITWTSPNAPTITLAGFRSRWITPRLWAKATAKHTCSNARTSRSRSSGSGSPAARAARSSSARVRPWISFIARNGRPSANVFRSWTGGTEGCWRRPVMRASATNRRSASDPARSGPTTLTATSRQKAVSIARYTTPIPPRASSAPSR
ncbi:MAG: hypothetical protein U0871_09575 [Gemmataceae bacterium]